METPTILFMHDKMIAGARGMYTEALENCQLLSPTEELAKDGNRISASSLKIGTHFNVKPISRRFDAAKAVLHTQFNRSEWSLDRTIKDVGSPLAYYVHNCQTGVLRLCHLLGYKIRNETELRFAFGDPILKMICDLWGFKVSEC